MTFCRMFGFEDGTEGKLITYKKTLERLATTCFRGKNVRRAGNFRRWDSIEKLMREPFMRDSLFEIIRERYKKEYEGTWSEMICHPDSVGWTSTGPQAEYPSETLEQFTPNQKSSALRVKSTHRHLPAPQTKTITFVMEFRFERGEYIAVIHSIYPGEDVGELCGDLTAREGVVFFDWSHPGAAG